jgi:hypothetical protein
MIYGGIMNLPTNLSFSEDMMTMKQIGIQQNFSVRRKYNLRRAIAQKEFEMSSYEVKAQQLSLTKEVKQQYYELYAQNKSIETAKSWKATSTLLKLDIVVDKDPSKISSRQSCKSSK